ncbi:hypothetical protein HPB50_020469 [Hyalomma asiaticum]|uniref:Uncharacterized protein n=1 Tax=Hyalomma asiaticum TaxID=266040 RepID=A0ACB7S8L9_HYAAI|nr:hypothetical protein HPB50_020469 [Hyalomma asiaticum]
MRSHRMFDRFYGHYSLNVIARCAFGTTLDSHSDATNEFVTEARKGFSARVSWKVLLFVLFPGLLKYLKINASRGGTSQYFKEVCQRIVRDRHENGKRLEDFLQLMIDAQDGNLTAPEETSADPENKIFDVGSDTKPEAPTSTKRLTETEAMAQCVLFFLVGLETTSMTLALATYHLALNPAVQEKLRKEVDECMAEHGPEPSLDAIMSLKYLHCVVLETLRLYPPAPSSVIVPIYAMHRDPAVFPDPERFVPERFSDENVESIRPYTYLPFGAGPRNCIGMRLGLQSIKLRRPAEGSSPIITRNEFERLREVRLAQQGLGSQLATQGQAERATRASGALE